MSVVVVLIGLSIIVAGGFLIAFFWAVNSGQYTDTEAPAMRILFDETVPKNRESAQAQNDITTISEENLRKESQGRILGKNNHML